MFELVETVSQQAVIKVIGVGGGGGNAIEHMLTADFNSVDFINANTDAQVLSRSNANTVLQIGEKLTKGLGAGADPEVGRQAAIDDRDRIESVIDGADMVFITAGMGGGTGTGAAPVVAEISREKGALTVAVITRPFPFEGSKRHAVADAGIKELQDQVDSLIIIPNEKVMAVMGHEATLVDAFNKANEVLQNAVQGISELITRPGLMNVDFADVRAVMSEMGMAMMGSATVSGENRAIEATQQAISSPLLEDINLHGAKGMLVNITAGPHLTIGEFTEVGTEVSKYAASDANVVIGTAVDPEMDLELRVTMVATGLMDAQGKISGKASAKSVEKEVSIKPVPSEDKPVQPVENPVLPPVRGISQHRLGKGGAAVAAKQMDLGDLDIPSFLRKQAD